MGHKRIQARADWLIPFAVWLLWGCPAHDPLRAESKPGFAYSQSAVQRHLGASVQDRGQALHESDIVGVEPALSLEDASKPSTSAGTSTRLTQEETSLESHVVPSIGLVDLPNDDLASHESGVSHPIIAAVAPSHVKVGDVVQVTVSVNAVEDLYSAPFHLMYEPSLMEFLWAKQGDFLTQDGTHTTFLNAADPVKGRIIVGQSRLGSVAGISGSGILATFMFRAKAQGAGALGFSGVDLRNTALEPITERLELSEVVIE